jgi:hypothetical protein|tara:strand:- start:70 stop:933 length:864 start_codon:yes stop_codon:yes gene_type:complete
MAALTGTTIKSTYGDLAQVSNGGAGVDGTLRNVSSGLGTNSSLQLSTTAAKVQGDLTITGTTTVNALTFSGGGGFLVSASNLSDVANAATSRSNLGIAIGSNVQAYSADLTAIAALAKTDGNIIVGSGSAWVAENGATARTSLGLSIGSNVQAYDADLTALAGLSSSDSNFIVGSASGWVAESGATARTSLGLGSMATQAHGSVDIDGGSITGITDLAVADGGTGQGSYTNGQLLIGNTTGNTLAKATITAGTGISVTNGAGAITIASTSSGGISMGKAIAAAIVFG